MSKRFKDDESATIRLIVNHKFNIYAEIPTVLLNELMVKMEKYRIKEEEYENE